MKSIGYVAVGLVLGLALLVGYERWKTPPIDRKGTPQFGGLGAGGDDEPIIIAGGSLHFFLPKCWEFIPGGTANDPMSLYDRCDDGPVIGRYISRFEALNPDGSRLAQEDYTKGTAVDVTITFCNGNCGGGGGDPNNQRTITFRYDGTKFLLEESFEHGGAFKKAFGQYLKHYTKKNFKIAKIGTKVGGNEHSWDCPGDGDCDVRLKIHI